MTATLTADLVLKVEQAIARHGFTASQLMQRFDLDYGTVRLIIARTEGKVRRPSVNRARYLPEQVLPCGTHAAYNRHRAHNETPCKACRAGESRYQSARHRRRNESRQRAA